MSENHCGALRSIPSSLALSTAASKFLPNENLLNTAAISRVMSSTQLTCLRVSLSASCSICAKSHSKPTVSSKLSFFLDIFVDFQMKILTIETTSCNLVIFDTICVAYVDCRYAFSIMFFHWGDTEGDGQIRHRRCKNDRTNQLASSSLSFVNLSATIPTGGMHDVASKGLDK